MPLYYCVLAGVLIYQLNGFYSPEYLHISGGSTGAWLHFLFLKGDSVFWTLAAEFGFYILLPPIVYGVRRFGWVWLAAACVTYFLAFLAVELLRLPIPLKFVDISHRSQFLDVFCCGILAACLPHRWSDKWVPLAFWGLLFATLVFVSANFLGARQPLFSLRWLSLLYGGVFGLAIISGVGGNPALTKPLSYRPLIFMGRVGYGLYLLHFPVFQFVNTHLAAGPVVRFFVVLPISCLLAWVANWLIEVPMINVGRKLEAWIGISRTRLMPEGHGAVSKNL